MILFAAMALATASSPEPHAEAHEATNSARHASAHPANLFTLRAISGTEYGEHPHTGWGAGLSYARHILPHLLEVEVGVTGLFAADASSVAIDTRLDLPLPLGRTLELHVGLGPLLRLEWAGEPAHRERHLRPGGIGSIELLAWPAEHLGIVTNVDALLMSVDGASDLEVELGLGLAMRM